MSFLIPSAFADTFGQIQTANTQAANPYSSILLLAGFVVIFYFMFIRPQNKRVKEQKNLLANLQVGDTVVTTGGLIGIVQLVEDQFVVLNVSKTSVIKFQKSAIASALPKGTLEV